GDDLTKIEAYRLEMLRKILPPTGVAATFEDDSMNIGTVSLPDAKMICVLNWEDEQKSFRFKLPGLSDISDYWTGERVGKRQRWPAGYRSQQRRFRVVS